MDPPPPPAATSSNGANKLRLMCSHGGHFLPRPRTNTLFYAGGETRIVSFHRHNLATISSFTSHISATLSVAPPFNIKYHLPPHLHLDSLISLSSDDDLAVLLDENRRLNSTPYRIRLFLFFFHSSPRSAAAIRHPKTEAWFFDALKSAKIMERDAHVTSQEFCSSVAESMVLDTTSSFGSTSSSTSSTNLPPLRAQADENNNNDFVLKDSKGKLNSSDSISCDNTVSSSVMSHQLNISYEDPAVYHISEARTNAESVEAENKLAYISSGVMVNNMNMDLGYASFPQYNQVGSPHLQFVQAPQQILPIHSSGLLPLPSCQPMYQQPQPLQNMVYYPNQSCAVYLVPIGNIAPNGFPIAASGKASLNLNPDPPLMNVHVAYKPMGEARSPFGHDFAPPDYLTDNAMTASSTHVTQQQDMDIYSFYHQSPNVSINSGESPEFENELDDGLARDQIYKSQPPPPKYPTMSKATTNLLSEALAKLHVDNLKQQTEQ